MPVSLTGEDTWLQFLDDLPEWRPRSSPVIVLVPHPDDETLGAGGFIAALRRKGIPVTIVAVTDGEAAYQNSPGLGEVRRAEQEDALRELGVALGDVIRLALPDSQVAGREAAIVEAVGGFLSGDHTILATWSHDPHPDHEAVGRAAECLATRSGAQLVSYLFWTWHWRCPDVLSGLPLRRFEVDEQLQSARSLALSHHRSQLHREDGEPVLSDTLLAPARRKFETFIVHE